MNVFFFQSQSRPRRDVVITGLKSFHFAVLLGLVFLGLDLLRLSLFRGDTLLSSASGFLVLSSASLGLVSQLLRTKGLGLLFVDELHQNALVLEHITLALDVELVVKMAVDLLR